MAATATRSFCACTLGLRPGCAMAHGLTLVHLSAQHKPFWSEEPFCVQFVTSYDPSILLHATEPPKLSNRKCLR
jgi:hypothetical protein